MEIEPELFFLHFGNNRPVYRILTVPVQVYGSTEGNSMVKWANLSSNELLICLRGRLDENLCEERSGKLNVCRRLPPHVTLIFQMLWDVKSRRSEMWRPRRQEGGWVHNFLFHLLTNCHRSLRDYQLQNTSQALRGEQWENVRIWRTWSWRSKRSSGSSSRAASALPRASRASTTGFPPSNVCYSESGRCFLGHFLGFRALPSTKERYYSFCDFCLSWLTILSPLRQVLALVVPTWSRRTRRRRRRGTWARPGPSCWTTTVCASPAGWRTSRHLRGWAAALGARFSVRAMLGSGSRLSQCFKMFTLPFQRPEFLLTKPPQQHQQLPGEVSNLSHS